MLINIKSFLWDSGNTMIIFCKHTQWRPDANIQCFKLLSLILFGGSQEIGVEFNEINEMTYEKDALCICLNYLLFLIRVSRQYWFIVILCKIRVCVRKEKVFHTIPNMKQEFFTNDLLFYYDVYTNFKVY